ncbi:streptomycin 6-kinase [Okibacterium sp. HSC-33S16]|uniref:aminoglycoside phosphotransferase family protein n=1 Tax=Okibacterium sp. HSC-33S16 TaxID=2910965 RepID=UPI00209DB3E0|nr:aminoglycoside phosphotransferase family protein [Okibacterium sp. HSC-33S16]MCP2032040.1 streptomycin 6-kinase [Okibacterium sp. HSC-33S16]
MSSWRPATVEQKCAEWQLTAVGAAMSTPSSVLQPVLRGGERAMLKVARLEEEANGCRLLAWWDGRGAAPVFEHDDQAVVVAWGGGSLVEVAASGHDDRATRVLCEVAARLHAVSRADFAARPAGLIPLDEWFRSLFARPDSDGFYARAARVARRLLERPTDSADLVVLHGDLHHDNVLNFGDRLGWLAIDPKFLIGHRAFDYANILCNPEPALAETQFDRRLTVLSELAGLDEIELIEWTVAWTGLSASWFAADGNHAAEAQALRIGALAERRLASR